MPKSPNKDDYAVEYQEFMDVGPHLPPPGLSERVAGLIHGKLNPPLWTVLGKLTLIYTVMGLLVLLICPQFGLTLAARNGVLSVFALLGHYPCMALCGALFLGSGTLMASLVLLPEELRKLKPLRWVYFAGYGAVALSVFALFGAEIAAGMGMAWLAGAVAGESLGFEFGWRVRGLLPFIPGLR